MGREKRRQAPRRRPSRRMVGAGETGKLRAERSEWAVTSPGGPSRRRRAGAHAATARARCSGRLPGGREGPRRGGAERGSGCACAVDGATSGRGLGRESGQGGAGLPRTRTWRRSAKSGSAALSREAPLRPFPSFPSFSPRKQTWRRRPCLPCAEPSCGPLRPAASLG